MRSATREVGKLTREEWAAARRSLLGLLLLMVAVMGVSLLFRPEAVRFGEWFVGRFGRPGMAFGTFLAEAVHFPVPAQFYMWVAIVGGGSQAAAMAWIAVGSVLGGATAYFLLRSLAGTRLAQRVFARGRGSIERILARHGALALVISSLTPVPFSTLCCVLGFYRMPVRLLGLILALRVPRLLLFYALIRAGWRLSSG